MNYETRGHRISTKDVRNIIARAGKNGRERELRRIKAHLRRPEEPGLSPEARHWVFF